ncbi:MAG: hypothetical protein AAGA37_12785 [Actinomycetota bacterium]
MERARAAGRHLADRHRQTPTAPHLPDSLLNYAEVAREGDWTLRSALVRLAQSQPQLVADLLTLVRRLDAVLHHVARPLAAQTVMCDRAITLETSGREPSSPYPDTRCADVARLAYRAGADGHVVIDAYVEVTDLTGEERMAIPLLGVAVLFDELAERLVAWALVAPASAPVEDVRAVITAGQQRLDELGVPVEDRPQHRGGRSRR